MVWTEGQNILKFLHALDLKKKMKFPNVNYDYYNHN